MEENGEDSEVCGCEHYKRKCAFISPCCQKVYTCRLCHDEHEDHTLDRYKVSKVQCLKCGNRQPVEKNCIKCGIEFGHYFCSVCRLYDNIDKKQFHCEPCGICRVGGRENFFHCKKCDLCLGLVVKDTHKCVEKASRANCPVCMEDLHTSRIPSHVPSCGHLLHRSCYEELLKSGNYTCPLCNVSLVEMDGVWKHLDEEVENTPMPEEYSDLQLQILCRDCHKESRTRFHVVGLKCQYCGSYNTCRAAEPTATGDTPQH
ncbi:hypothetical protein NP493_527g04011 [Ridgeia piscesae]|uniref:RING finger and CHY zinc finger domain-containing protein 1 n=1 Tax=Ridgeia piscesae TaxID=27915 RepID=A0AAD9NQN3_RIDPI|nr:hypothetical protein NP493_527g04011 [Ridgeia piscesae]